MPAKSQTKPLVGVIMGSRNDYSVMRAAVEVLREFGVAHEAKVVSAHRTPDQMFAYAEAAAGRGLRVIIAGAGGAAHLPGMVAAKTVLPVLGVPIAATALQGLDSLLSIVPMPKRGPPRRGPHAIPRPRIDNRGPRVSESAYPTLLPGATIGIFGGGQLGRLTAMAARGMGYRIHVLAPDPGCPARFVVDQCVEAGWDDAREASDRKR